jgi:hypothetical protein
MGDDKSKATGFQAVADEVLRQGKPTPDELRMLETEGATKPGEEDEPMPLLADEAQTAREGDDAVAETPAAPGTLPEWAREAIPADLTIPPGRTVVVMKFLPEWTDAVHKGERTCVMWNLSVGDEKLANQRGGDNYHNNLIEKAKQMIRAIDGRIVDYTGKNPTANLDTWWNEIGLKCRALVTNHYYRAHSLTTTEKMDFLAHCCVARTCLPATSHT